MATSEDPELPRRDDERDAPDDQFRDEPPRRRRRSRRDEDDFYRNKRDNLADDFDDYAGDPRESALSKVRVPALLMIIGGIIYTVGAVATIVGGIVMSLNVPNKGDEVFAYLIIGFGLVAVPFFTMLTVGAFRMRKLRNYYLAFTSSILSILSIFSVCLCGLLGILGLLMVPLGIWSLVVLLDAEVVREFKRGPVRSSIRQDRDDEFESKFE